MSKKESKDKGELIHIAKWNDHHEFPPYDTISKWIYRAAPPGFKETLRRMGNKWYIHEQEFLEWTKKRAQE